MTYESFLESNLIARLKRAVHSLLVQHDVVGPDMFFSAEDARFEHNLLAGLMNDTGFMGVVRSNPQFGDTMDLTLPQTQWVLEVVKNQKAPAKVVAPIDTSAQSPEVMSASEHLKK